MARSESKKLWTDSFGVACGKAELRFFQTTIFLYFSDAARKSDYVLTKNLTISSFCVFFERFRSWPQAPIPGVRRFAAGTASRRRVPDRSFAGSSS